MSTSNIAADAATRNNDAVTSRDRAWLEKRILRGANERFCETVTLTPSLAALMIERNTENRTLSPGGVEKLGRVMMEGRWKLSTQGVAFAKDGHLIDGQHRLTACVDYDTEVPMTVWFGCETEEFAIIDSGRNRTAADLLSIDKLDYAKLRSALAGLMIQMQFRNSRRADIGLILAKALEMRSESLDESIRQGHRIVKIVGSATGGAFAHFRIAGTTRFSHLLHPFWDSLVNGANLEAKSPILRLRDWFRDGGLKPYNSRDRSFKAAAAIIIAWNAYTKKQAARNFAWDKIVELPEVN